MSAFSMRVFAAVAFVALWSANAAQAQPNGKRDLVPNYRPVTVSGRIAWFGISTVGPVSLLLAGPISAGFGTALNRPKEYGTHWDGFGERYGIRLTGISTGAAIEASLGSVWREDPRYFPSPDQRFGSRVKYVVKSTFTAPHKDGSWHPAYARFAGNVGNNFLSNTWRANSEASARDGAIRCIWGVTNRMAGQAFAEFWPDVRKLIFKR
jgi:hypothetical protein